MRWRGSTRTTRATARPHGGSRRSTSRLVRCWLGCSRTRGSRSGSVVAPTMERNEREHLVLAAVFLALAVAAVYLPALEGGFINWDDPDYVTANPHIRELSWNTVTWAFGTF